MLKLLLLCNNHKNLKKNTSFYKELKNNKTLQLIICILLIHCHVNIFSILTLLQTVYNKCYRNLLVTDFIIFLYEIYICLYKKIHT